VKLPGIILAAGSSTRMGRPKALLPLGDSTFLARLIETFYACCEPVIVVLGGDADAVRAALAGSPVVAVFNPDHQLGMLSSLQAGLTQMPAGAPGAVFTLVDHPRLKVETLQAVLQHFEQSGAEVVIPRHGGKRGHPVAISRRVADELLAMPKSGSPKDVIRGRRAATVFVDLDDPAIVEDIDTPGDYKTMTR
jgi:molybdenum cofactor cytidylyltransferase